MKGKEVSKWQFGEDAVGKASPSYFGLGFCAYHVELFAVCFWCQTRMCLCRSTSIGITCSDSRQLRAYFPRHSAAIENADVAQILLSWKFLFVQLTVAHFEMCHVIKQLHSTDRCTRQWNCLTFIRTSIKGTVDNGVRATVVTAGHCTHAELTSGHALASCCSCCVHSEVYAN